MTCVATQVASPEVIVPDVDQRGLRFQVLEQMTQNFTAENRVVCTRLHATE